MQVFLSRIGLLFIRPGEAFRRVKEAPLPWAGVLWGLSPAILALFVTAWAVTRRWFDPYYSGMAGLVFGGGWVLSLVSLAVATRLLRGRSSADALTEASALAYTPILVGMLLPLPRASAESPAPSSGSPSPSASVSCSLAPLGPDLPNGL